MKTPPIEPIVKALVESRLDPTKSRAFATELIRELSNYKPTQVSSARMRKDLLGIADAFESAISAMDNATDATFHCDTMHYLSTYGVGHPALNVELMKHRVWNKTIKKYWPHIDRVPPIEAIRAYLSAYASQARQHANHLPSPRRGAQYDFERYRPVLYCARAWRNSFGTRPGKGLTSPFVRACAVALPLFGMKIPSKLHTFVQRAFEGLDLERLS